MSMNQVASDLYKALTESDERKPKPYDVKATVLREEGNIVWVKIPGGVDETPVQKTNNANAGDDVMVRISGGRAWLLGNETSPATDDAVANAATQLAEGAGNLAKTAADSASEAQKSAQIAYNYANSAQSEALRATENANTANYYALEAQDSASFALREVGSIENVVDTLTWISEHGFYALSEDQIVQDKTYYSLIGTVIERPIGNPSLNKYYVRLGLGTEADPYYYEKSTDTTVVEGTVYYSIQPTMVANPSGNPSENLYYESKIDEAVTQYIGSRISLTNEGLSIQSDTNSNWRVLIKNNGIDIIGNGAVVASYSDTIRLGRSTSFVQIANNVMQFYLLNRMMALFGYVEEFESYGLSAENVMLKGAGNALRLDNGVNGAYQGQYILETRANGHLSLKPGLSRTEE